VRTGMADGTESTKKSVAALEIGTKSAAGS
jgi:hypothetical protein